ncbi:MAG: hypothetical protein IBX71_00790 [Candidatus Desulforudis sp.]|nr:hypothetical protein [Desulforudis sp.]
MPQVVEPEVRQLRRPNMLLEVPFPEPVRAVEFTVDGGKSQIVIVVSVPPGYLLIFLLSADALSAHPPVRPIVRLDRKVLGLWNTGRPSQTTRERLTVSVFRQKSMSRQRKPNTSPRRRPRRTASRWAA